jgi:hypothetical protein
MQNMQTDSARASAWRRPLDTIHAPAHHLLGKDLRTMRTALIEPHRVKAWLDGVTPVWTALSEESFNALRYNAEPPSRALKIADDFLLEETQSSAIARNMQVLLRAADVRPGLKLTATGNLARSVVARMCAEFSWPGFDREEHFRYNKVINEPDFYPLWLVDELARAAKLVRRYDGHLRTNANGRTAIHSPALQALLFHMMFWRLAPDHPGREMLSGWPRADIGLVPWGISVAANNWESAERLTRLITSPTNAVLENAWDIGSFTVESDVLRPLHWFGLLDVDRDSNRGPTPRRSDHYRKTPLFDRFLSFSVKLDGDDGVRH